MPLLPRKKVIYSGESDFLKQKLDFAESATRFVAQGLELRLLQDRVTISSP